MKFQKVISLHTLRLFMEFPVILNWKHWKANKRRNLIVKHNTCQTATRQQRQFYKIDKLHKPLKPHNSEFKMTARTTNNSIRKSQFINQFHIPKGEHSRAPSTEHWELHYINEQRTRWTWFNESCLSSTEL